MSQYIPDINWVDIFIVILLIRTCYTGYARGVGYEAITLLGIIGAAILTVHNYEYLGLFFRKELNLPVGFSNLISFIMLGTGAFYVFRLARDSLYRFLRFEIFPAVERFGGLALGFVRGALLVSLILLGMLLVQRPQLSMAIKYKSYSGPMFLKVIPVAYDYVIGLFPKYEDTERNELIREVLSHEPRKEKIKSHLKKKQPKRSGNESR